MLHFTRERMPHIWRLVLPCALALGILGPLTALAHGGGVPQITDAPAGPYRLFAWSSPDPWQTGAAAHITVAVTVVDGAGQTTPVGDAQVTVVLTTAGEPTQRVQFEATPNLTATGFYEADGELPVAGAWRVEVLVNGALGAGHGVFTNTVQPGSSNNWLIWLGVGVLALVGFVSIRQRTVKARAAQPHRALSAR